VTNVKASDLMTLDVATCRPTDSMNRAAQILWERDCGCVPVVDEQGKITDRDICMAAYTTGQRLEALSVANAMSESVVSCRMDEDLDELLETMAQKQVHRLPVVDRDQRLAGMVSLTDVVRAISALDGSGRSRGAVSVLGALDAVSRPRSPRAPAKISKRQMAAATA
jgi:CBS-domain-containing membrane protein